MRPHRLRVTAFGPFAGTVEVDLDTVSAAGPFLLQGATGAGKTSLLDAVGYALFGRVPGSRGMKQLRSDHAADGVRTSVELWATVSGRAVHVVRTPDQRRPRARGAGWTTDKATVAVRVARDLAALQADDCDARHTGVMEANDELARLVGMTHEQFLQVVLLPQGEFARFLRAKDDERAGVLRALFDTGRFGAVEQHLRRRRDDTRARLAAAEEAVRTAAARVAAHAGVEDPPTDGQSDWAEGLLEQASGAVAAAATVADETSGRLLLTRAEHDAAARHAELLQDLLAAARARDDLLGQAPAVRSRADELDAADRAAEVVGLHQEHRAAAQRARAALADLTISLAALPPELQRDALDQVGPEEVGLEEAGLEEAGLDRAGRATAVSETLQAHLHEAVRAHAALEALEREVDRRQELVGEVATRRDALTAAQEEVARLRSLAAGLPARLEDLAAELVQQRAAAATEAGAAHDVRRWEELAPLAGALEALLAEVAEAEERDLQARAAARSADQHLDDLRRARVAGMSAELAVALRAGEPCSVCGATEHPAPATGTDAVVDAEDEEAARGAAERRAAVARTTGADLARVQARRDAVHARLDAGTLPEVSVVPLEQLRAGDVDALGQQLGARLTVARTRLAESRAAAGQAELTAERLEGLRAEQAGLDERRHRAEATVSSLAAGLAAATGEHDRLSAALAGALGDPSDDEGLAERWERRTRVARQHLDAVRCAGDAATALLRALDGVARARQAAARACVEAGWADGETAQDAARTREWREATRAMVVTHERDLHAATGRVAELHAALAQQAPTVPADLEVDDGADPAGAIEDAAAAARERVDASAGSLAETQALCREAEDSLSRRRTVLDGLARAVPGLVEAERSTHPLRAAAQAARELADLCSGANDKAVPLSTYVLSAHLEHVVVAANQRLHGMSDGRYALVHVEEGEDRRRRAGLGLAVLDAWTGRQRPAGTLSGGETFLASLALALGLADVVTAEAGGVRIDTLFVDEGFGTLDADSLDRAMDVLDQLQEHGRMVGVVSHVTELQQRLPRQVHVRTGRGGSTVEVRAG